MKAIKMTAALLAASLSVCVCSCGKTNKIAYNCVNDNFRGIGFEWDMYDSTDNAGDDVCAFTEIAADKFSPSAVRIMFDLDKFCVRFDGNGDPVYDFETQPMKNLYAILDYCQKNDVETAVGIWHCRYEGSYIFEAVKDEGNSLFALLERDLLIELINGREYSCIKYLVPYNEPNYSRRYRNGTMLDPYAMWSDCMTNLDALLSSVQFKSTVRIAGPDMSTLNESGVWLKKAERDFSDCLGIYEFHAYPSSYLVKTGGLSKRLSSILSSIEKDDREKWIYECGISDNITDSGQKDIKNVSYGLQTADLLVQAALSGTDGAILWSFDATMHQTNGQNADFGLVDSSSREYRPWFYSSQALSKALADGSKIYEVENGENVRVIAAEKDGRMCVVAINRGDDDVAIETQALGVKSDKLFRYVYSAESEFGENGNLICDSFLGSLEKKCEITLKGNSLTVVSTAQL